MPPPPPPGASRGRVVALHTAVALLATTTHVVVLQQDGPFLAASRDVLDRIVLEHPRHVERDGARRAHVYTVADVERAVNATIVRVFALPKSGLDFYALDEDGDGRGAAAPVQLRTRHYADTARKLVGGALETLESQFNVSGPDVDWLAVAVAETQSSSPKAFFTRLVEMEMRFSLRTLHRELDHFQQFEWESVVRYNLAARGGRIELTVEAVGSHTRTSGHVHWELISSACTVALVVALQATLLRQHGARGCVLPRFRQRGSGDGGKLWTVALSGANALLVCAAFLDYGEASGSLSANVQSARRWAYGFGCFVVWACLTQHLEKLPPYDIALVAMRRGLPVVVRFVVGFLPIMMGFAVLGMALFNERTEKFSSLSAALMTLFSVMNGDVLLETARDIGSTTLGNAYVVSYCTVFIFVVMSVFVSIVQDAYQQAKRANAVAPQREWPSSPRSPPYSPHPLAPAGAHLSGADARALAESLSRQLAAVGEQLRVCAEAQERLIASLDGLPAQPVPSASGGTSSIHHRAATAQRLS